MTEAYPLWAELERQADARLLHEVGLLYFGSADSTAMRSMIAGLRELKVEHEILEPRRAGEVLPTLRLNQGEIGVFTREAGWVDASGAIRANLRLLRALGAVILPDHPVRWEQLESDFDAYVVCPGPWIRQFADVQVRTTLQTFAYVDRQYPLDGPVWIEDGPSGMYGLPTEDDRIEMKIGVHIPGREVAMDDLDRTPSEAHLALIEETARRRFGIDDPQLIDAKGCVYTATANEDFILGRLGDRGFFASACSGHGFKFGPWIGKLLANFVEGEDEPENHPRFFWSQPVIS